MIKTGARDAKWKAISAVMRKKGLEDIKKDSDVKVLHEVLGAACREQQEQHTRQKG